MTIAIKIENLSKQYRLGLVSTRTLSHDLNRWYQTTIRGKDDPYLKIGEIESKRRSYGMTDEVQMTPKANNAQNANDYIWALRDINLEVEQGEVLGIIGKNGAGKSTLLKILSKVTAPTNGTIKARGRIASLLEVGTGFHPEMTGRENIFMNGAIMGMCKAEITRKLDEIIDFAGVEQFIDTPVKRYSSGMTVRLGFAVAAHLESEILVVDEVLAVGDAEFQKKAIGKMQDISKGEGRTVLFVSHNLTSISYLCRTCIELKNGELTFFGFAEDCIAHYLKEDEKDILIPNKITANKNGFEVAIDIRSKFRNDNLVFPGKPIVFDLTIKSPYKIKQGGIGLGINDRIGNRILTYHSHFELKESIRLDEITHILIEEPFNKLCQGEYFLILTIFENVNSIVSWPDIGKLRIEEFDLYNTGKLPATGYQGTVLSNAKWEIT